MKRQISAVRVCVRACGHCGLRLLKCLFQLLLQRKVTAGTSDISYMTQKKGREEERRKKNYYPDYWVLNFFFLLSVCVSLGFRNKLTVYNDAYSVESIKVDGIVGPSMPTDRCVCECVCGCT